MGTYLNGYSLGIKYLPIYLCFNQELHKLIYIYIELLLILLKKSDYPTSCQALDGSCSLFFIICFYVGVVFTRGGFIITKSCKQLNYLARKRGRTTEQGAQCFKNRKKCAIFCLCEQFLLQDCLNQRIKSNSFENLSLFIPQALLEPQTTRLDKILKSDFLTVCTFF